MPGPRDVEASQPSLMQHKAVDCSGAHVSGFHLHAGLQELGGYPEGARGEVLRRRRVRFSASIAVGEVRVLEVVPVVVGLLVHELELALVLLDVLAPHFELSPPGLYRGVRAI